MKIYIVSRGYPTEEYKMNGIFEMDQAKALVRAGHDVVFLSVDLRSIRRKRKFGMDSFTQEGVRVYSIDLPLGALPKSIFYKLGIGALKKVFKKAVAIEGKPDIIHTYFTDQGYMVTRGLGDLGIPLVLTEPNSHINKDEIDPLLKEAATYAYSKVDKLITVSPDFQKKIKDKFGKDSTVLTVIPDLEIFSYNKDLKEGPSFKFVCTGRVTVAKGMEDLVQAFILAFDKEERVSLDIFGDGADRARLEALVADRGYGHMIKFWGMTDRKTIAHQYQKADVFVLYSHSETFGLANLEALASGLPVISSKCGGPEHLINKDNGLLVDLNDIGALAHAMKYMRENIDKYDSEKISALAKSQYSPEAITRDLVEIYKELGLG